MKKRVWITWETQRRSIELAKKLGCELHIIEESGFLRYFKSILKTLSILKHSRPDILFVQNPSMILATLACIYKQFVNVPVVVDRHTTFLLNKDYKYTMRIIIFKLLHHLTVRFSNLTIVTNEFLADIIRQMKGRPFILPDMIPELSQKNPLPLKGRHNILLISSFGEDEPIKECLDAMRVFHEDEVCMYITGNYKKLEENLVRSAPPNVVFTGFMEEQEFVDMLFSVDAVMVLTTADSCMLCGCYEAVSVCKPLITSNKKVLEEYFKGAVFVDNTTGGISNAVKEVSTNIDGYGKKIQNLKKSLKSQWDEMFNNLEDQLDQL